MAANPVRLMTVEEFRTLPEPNGDHYYELHHGELVAVTRPKLKHYAIQARLQDLLRRSAPGGSFVGYELAFRALPEHELRVADVAYVSPERWAAANRDDNLQGAPELVIEILSPSNSAREMYEKEQLCFAAGCREFWVVDPDARLVRVARVDGPTSVYTAGEQVSLPMFGAVSLAVDEIFA
jgi:Uma2 family endonuclease